jgi:hypothetical protein
MCTLSFLRLSQGYSLMMNRDESPLRPQAQELREARLEGACSEQRALYPVDPAGGGTWIGVNEDGIAFALMNQYPEGYQRPAQAQSRGRLIPEALRADQAMLGLERVGAMDLSRTPPFVLLGFDGHQGPLSLRWDGRALERRLYEDGALELSSSAFQPEAVLPERQAQFARMLQSLEGADEADCLQAQEAYHLSQEPEPGPFAVWMTRDDSRSVSFEQVLVLPKQVVLRHRLRAEVEAGQPGSLARLNRAADF